MSDQFRDNPTPAAPPNPGQPQQPRSTYRPYTTYIILGVTILAFLLQMYTEWAFGTDLMFSFGGKINEAIIAGEYWRILTPVFLHGSLMHILFNMYFLYMVGPMIEQFYGRLRFLLLYFVSGVAGNVVSFYLSPNPSLGASTALFGLMAAQGVFFYRNRQVFAGQSRSLIRNTLMIVGINLVFGVLPGTNIDMWGHIGGLLGGVAFAWACGPRLEVSWLPGGGYKVNDHSMMSTAWLTAGVELAVLIGLVLLRVMQG